MNYRILLTYNLEDAKQNQHTEFKKAMIELGWEETITNTTLISNKTWGLANDAKDKLYDDLKKVQKTIKSTVEFTYGLCVYPPESDTLDY